MTGNELESPPPLRGRVREGGMLCCFGNDHFQNAIPIAQDIRTPETENAVAFRLEPSITLDITFALGMLSAIDFDDQTSVMTNEIDNEASDRSLASKSQSVQPMSAQRRPKTLLSVGHFAPQRLGACALKSRDRPMGG